MEFCTQKQIIFKIFSYYGNLKSFVLNNTILLTIRKIKVFLNIFFSNITLPTTRVKQLLSS